MANQETARHPRLNALAVSEPILRTLHQGTCRPAAAGRAIDDPSARGELVAEPAAQARAPRRDEEEMIAEHLPLVRIIAGLVHRSLPRHVLLDDLVQAGVVGLLDAMTKFDPRRQVE